MSPVLEQAGTNVIRPAIISIVFILAMIGSSVAELEHGFGKACGFDFSEQRQILDFDSADVWLAVVDPPGGTFVYTCENGSRLAVFPGSTLAQVPEAPADPAEYGCSYPASTGVMYVVQTVDGLYAKFVLLDVWECDMEYYVQTDGSRNLDPGIPIEPSTWGRIKALYRERVP